MINFLLGAVEDVLLSVPLIGAYVIFGLGIVVIFRASRVLNLAHGAMAMAPAYVYFQMTSRWHLPVALGLIVGVASGALLGYVVERGFVRPLRKVSPTAQTVGTVAAFGLIVALVAKEFGTFAVQPVPVFPDTPIPIGSAILRVSAIGLFFVGLAVAGALYALFKFTDVGLAMRASADNRRAASLMGVDPQRMTTIAWLLGGGTAGLAGILLAATTNLEPYTLSLQALPGFVAVIIGGLEGLLGAVVGGAIVGVVIGLVPILPFVGNSAGAPQLILMLLAFVVMFLRGQRLSASDVRAEGIGTEVTAEKAKPPSAKNRLWRADVVAVGAALVLVFPAIPGLGSNFIADANQAMEYAVIGISLVLLIGLVGQISLGQASFVGIGAFVTGLLIDHFHVPFPANLPIAAAVAGVVAALLGGVALRVRGLYLAVATLIFAWMCDAYLFQQPWLVGVGGSTSFAVPTVGSQPGFPFFDFSSRRTFYYVALAVLVAIAVSVALIRRSKTGRAFFAIRGSEVAAASLGIDVTRYKLLAFAMSGVIAGIAGNLFATNTSVIGNAEFAVPVSLFYLSIAVVGGLTSIGGAVAAGVLFAALLEVFFQVDALAGYLDVVSSGLLIVVLLLYPGGLAAIPRALNRVWVRVEPAVAPLTGALGRARVSLRQAVSSVRLRRGRAADGESEARPLQRLIMLRRLRGGSNGHQAAVEALAADPGATPLTALVAEAQKGLVALPVRREDREVLLEAEGVSMRFGGLLAVNNVSMSVRNGEIVGLIGPNGAGKTTTFNCISGLLVPTAGAVSLFGRRVTDVAVHERARMGLGRTFQVIQLFPQLTVFENLMVATHVNNPTGILAHLVVTKRAILAEREARHNVMHVVDLLGLHDVADRTVGGLPFGILRMVELARAIVTGARLIMLDEPASGLDNTETQRLADLLRTLRAGLGLTLLLIEHDVQMVTSVSDYMYVLDQGTLLAEGTPRDVQANQQVIAAYLGEPVEEGVA
ncbi:MAG TPA: branched-chain amino acid ABC transporter permease/ATP-binding protein [Candidatus Dormibacteraeota bacterium]|jgi:sulfate-transporting ATPase|nr:branched-chain amino acid ABC transporter permease/ATP-binding protein [Candidatus Dormibacteraeota bacterium]